LATLLEKKKSLSAAMADDIVDASKIDPEDINDAEYDDIPEERRKQFEAQLKKEQEEATRRLLACYERTRQGVIKKEKFVMPTFTPPPPNPSTMTTAAATSASTLTDVSLSFESIKQFAEDFCSRFEQS